MATGRTRTWDVLAVIALGGALGALARYAVSYALAHPAAGFAWSTLLVNVSGCFALGAFVVVLGQLTAPHRLARPFVAVGVLGGYTTYSTFAVDAQRLLVAHRPEVAFGYIALTLAGCLAAMWLAMASAGYGNELVLSWRRNRRRRKVMDRG